MIEALRSSEELKRKIMARPVRYSTRQRAAVLSALKAHAGKYLSAEEVVDAIRRDGEAVGRTTVYRTLETLTQEGVVRRFVSDKRSPALYEYLDNPSEAEYHVQCRSCGKLFHLRCSEIDRMTASLSSHLLQDHGVELDLQSSVIQGICSDCRKKAEGGGSSATHACTPEEKSAHAQTAS